MDSMMAIKAVPSDCQIPVGHGWILGRSAQSARRKLRSSGFRLKKQESLIRFTADKNVRAPLLYLRATPRTLQIPASTPHKCPSQEIGPSVGSTP